jgi:hypothetical protein
VLVAIVQVTSDRMAGKKSLAKHAAVACSGDDGQECDEERDAPISATMPVRRARTPVRSLGSTWTSASNAATESNALRAIEHGPPRITNPDVINAAARLAT